MLLSRCCIVIMIERTQTRQTRLVTIVIAIVIVIIHVASRHEEGVGRVVVCIVRWKLLALDDTRHGPLSSEAHVA
jgi:hypothetical protein